MPLLKRLRVFTAASETAMGTANATPLTASEGVYNAYDIDIQPTVDYHERKTQGSFSNLTGVIGNRMGTATFKTEYYGIGAATPGSESPAWADVLLPACGFIESAVDVYSPNSAAPDDDTGGTAGTGYNHTLTIGVFENGIYKAITGAMGSFKIVGVVGQPLVFEWTFMGLWADVTDQTIVAPTYPTVIPVKFSGMTFTWGLGSPACIENFSIDVANSVIMRPCASQASGYEHAVITDRKITGSFDPEAKLVATAPDDYADWIDSTADGHEAALSMSITDSTDTLTIAAGAAQRINIQEGDRSGIQTDVIDWQANSPQGDDELTLTFA